MEGKYLFVTIFILSISTLPSAFGTSEEVEDCIVENECLKQDIVHECGADGKGYHNACTRVCHGVEVADKSACACADCKESSWMVCKPGTKEELPEGCEAVCDGKEYSVCGIHKK